MSFRIRAGESDLTDTEPGLMVSFLTLAGSQPDHAFPETGGSCRARHDIRPSPFELGLGAVVVSSLGVWLFAIVHRYKLFPLRPGVMTSDPDGRSGDRDVVRVTEPPAQTR